MDKVLDKEANDDANKPEVAEDGGDETDKTTQTKIINPNNERKSSGVKKNSEDQTAQIKHNSSVKNVKLSREPGDKGHRERKVDTTEKSTTPSASKEKTCKESKEITNKSNSSSNDTTPIVSKSTTNNVKAKPEESIKPQKLKVHFVAVGSAPIMKRSKFLISPKESFARLQEKLSKMLQLNDKASSNHLFLYLHQSFVPSPEDLIGDLHDLFNVRDELILHYSLQEAWG